jgi:hypothetical protein
LRNWSDAWPENVLRPAAAVARERAAAVERVVLHRVLRAVRAVGAEATARRAALVRHYRASVLYPLVAL